MGLIYLATNKTNGKRYVGQTSCRTLNARGYVHEMRGKGTRPFIRALRKYGLDGFDWRVVFSDVSDLDLDVVESETIQVYNTMHPNGYNLKTGGARGKHSLSTRRLLSEIQKGRVGRRHTEQSRKLMSEKAKGKSKSVEHRKKLSNANKGKRKGLTYEDIYGSERAEEERLKRTATDSTRQRMSESQKKRKPPSEETREKTRRSVAAIWARRKAEQELSTK